MQDPKAVLNGTWNCPTCGDDFRPTEANINIHTFCNVMYRCDVCNRLMPHIKMLDHDHRSNNGGQLTSFTIVGVVNQAFKYEGGRWLWKKGRRIKAMTEIDEIYGKPLAPLLNTARCDELRLWGTELEIASAEVMTIQEKKKIRLTFENHEDTLAVNKTNAQILAEAFGKVIESWKGKSITLKKVKRMFQGKLVNAMEAVPVEASSGLKPVV